jgi:hypothetical protein
MLLMAGPSICVDPLLKVPVAVKDCFCPTVIIGAAGVTAIVCNVAVAANAPSVTSAAHNTRAILAGFMKPPSSALVEHNGGHS